MRDITFFEVYKDKQDRKAKNKAFIRLILITIIVASVSTIGVNFVTTLTLKSEIEVLKQTIDNPVLKERVKAIAVKNEEIAQYAKEIENINLLSRSVDSKTTINENLVKEVFNRVKPGMFLEKFNITEDTITLNGIAKDKETISEFEHSISGVDKFEYVFVKLIENTQDDAEISNESEMLRFDMVIKMAQNEIPQIQQTPQTKDAKDDKSQEKEVKKDAK